MKAFLRLRLWVRICLGFGGLGLFSLGWLYITLPSIDALDNPEFSLPTIIYDRHGNRVDSLYIKQRKLVEYDELPPHLINALLAKEDARFIDHHGIDPVRIVKAAWVNFLALDAVQGASTLTQQTARQFFLTLEKTWSRKFREILLALKIERKFSKKQIITLYLNKVNFGDVWGVSAAAEHYFGKEVQELNLEEGATLIGLLPAPNLYKPTRNPHLALKHRNIVLQRMENEEAISNLEYLAAIKRPLKIAAGKEDVSKAASYYVELVRRRLQEKFGSKKLYEGGLHVYTSMSLDFQRAAYKALLNGVREINIRQGYRPTEESVQLKGSQNKEIFASLNPSLPDGSVNGMEIFIPEKRFNAVVVSLNSQQALLQFSAQHQGLLLLNDVNKRWKILLRYQGSKLHQETFSSLARAMKLGSLVQVIALDKTQNGIRRFQLHQYPLANGAVYAADPNSGEVLAMVGGIRFGRSQGESEFIRATQAQRQPGSAFKPIIYAAALDEGFTPATILDDSPRTFVLQTGKKHTPQNYDQRFLGFVSLRDSLVRSRNVPTVQLVQNIGVDRVIEYSRKFGISTPIPREGLIALGTHSVKLSELTRAYGVFASGGYLAKPIYILRVEDSDGKILLENTPESEEIISPSTAFLITDILRDVVRRPSGTAYRALRGLNLPAAGKTGTTQNYTDAWYIGFLPQLIAGVYVGIDDHRKSLGSYETGSRAAAPVWKNFIAQISSLLTVESFLQPNSVVTHRVSKNGQFITRCDEQTEQRYELFKQESIPPRNKSACDVLPNIAKGPPPQSSDGYDTDGYDTGDNDTGDNDTDDNDTDDIDQLEEADLAEIDETNDPIGEDADSAKDDNTDEQLPEEELPEEELPKEELPKEELPKEDLLEEEDFQL